MINSAKILKCSLSNNFISLYFSSHRMPKNKKKSSEQVTCNNSSPVTQNKDGNVEIKVLAKPGAKISCITGIEEEGIGVQISAPPVDGEANEELVKFMSKVLDLRKSNVSLSKGSKSRQKTLVLLDSKLSCEDVVNKLRIQIES